MAVQQLNLAMLMAHQFSEAKKWWQLALVLRLLTVLFTALVAYTGLLSGVAVWISLALVIGAALAQRKSNYHKNLAEKLLRKKEWADGMAWEPSAGELRSDLLGLPDALLEQAAIDTTDGYFYANTAPSPQRLMMNLCESAWYSKHQAQRMYQYVLWLSVALLVIIIIALLLLVQSPGIIRSAENVTQIVMSLLGFIFAGGLFWLAQDYKAWAEQATAAQTSAAGLLRLAEVDMSAAIKNLVEYQLARSRAPLLPDWLWKHMRKQLNRLWEIEGGACSGN